MRAGVPTGWKHTKAQQAKRGRPKADSMLVSKHPLPPDFTGTQQTKVHPSHHGPPSQKGLWLHDAPKEDKLSSSNYDVMATISRLQTKIK